MSATFNLTLATDLQSVTIGLAVDDQQLGQATMTAEELSGFIELLGRVRKGMAEAIPEWLDPVPRLDVTDDPFWWVFDPTPEGQMVAFRHPGLGWLGFGLPQAAADKLAATLTKQRMQ